MYTLKQEISVRETILETLNDPITSSKMFSETGVKISQTHLSIMYVKYIKMTNMGLTFNFRK